MKTEELKKLSKDEVYKLYNQGKLTSEEVDLLPMWEQNNLKATKRADKKKEIIKLYKEGGLSISDTIAYENNLLLERNRKNTSTTASIVVVYVIIIVLAFFFGDDLFF
ncbi:hypothetical protein N9839_04985 [Flavobacteriaceae bacterium]|nr:hypothetical protein [Flavobacteriaceae bacterium]